MEYLLRTAARLFQRPGPVAVRTGGTNRPAQARLGLTVLEGRLTPAADVLQLTTPVPTGAYAVGADTGDAGTVGVYGPDGRVALQGAPYGNAFTHGIRVALADVDGDRILDLIVAPGPGASPDVKIYSGKTGALIDSFYAYEGSFTGGVFVAAADLTGDGKAEVVTGTDEGGGPRVRVFGGDSLSAGNTPTASEDFYAITDPNFRGGVRVALGDVTGDHVPDLVVSAGFGGGPRISVLDGAALAKGQLSHPVSDFYAFDSSLRNGAYVAVGDLTGTGSGDLIFGAGPGGGPRVVAISGQILTSQGPTAALNSPRANFFAGDPGGRGGVRVGVTSSMSGQPLIAAAAVGVHQAGAYSPDGTRAVTLTVPEGGNGVFISGSVNPPAPTVTVPPPPVTGQPSAAIPPAGPPAHVSSSPAPGSPDTSSNLPPVGGSGGASTPQAAPPAAPPSGAGTSPAQPLPEVAATLDKQIDRDAAQLVADAGSIEIQSPTLLLRSGVGNSLIAVGHDALQNKSLVALVDVETLFKQLVTESVLASANGLPNQAALLSYGKVVNDLAALANDLVAAEVIIQAYKSHVAGGLAAGSTLATIDGAGPVPVAIPSATLGYLGQPSPFAIEQAASRGLQVATAEYGAWDSLDNVNNPDSFDSSAGGLFGSVHGNDDTDPGY